MCVFVFGSYPVALNEPVPSLSQIDVLSNKFY